MRKGRKGRRARMTANGTDRRGGTMNGQRARPLMRGIAALALTMSLTVAGACGASTTEEKASAAKDQSPGRPARAASPTAAGSGGRGGMPQGSEPVKLDPADFSVSIDNPYWPMSPGTKWIYRETDTKGTNQKVVVEVTDETKMMANGIEA